MNQFGFYKNNNQLRFKHARFDKSLSKSKNIEQNFQNRSTSFQTVKKKYFQKITKRQRAHPKGNYSWLNLSQTPKKKRNLSQKSKKKEVNRFSLDDRSDFKPKIRYLETPKFGQNLLYKQNLTNNRLQLLFELQTIKKQFNHNLNQISLECLGRVSPLKQNISKSLRLNKESLQKQWGLIQKSCSQVKNQKDNSTIENMIWQWQKRRKRISDIERNIERAFSLLLL